jgi:hypothetical protein
VSVHIDVRFPKAYSPIFGEGVFSEDGLQK